MPVVSELMYTNTLRISVTLLCKTSESTCSSKDIYCVSLCVCTFVLNSDTCFLLHLFCFSSAESCGCWVKDLSDIVMLTSMPTGCKRDNCLGK